VGFSSCIVFESKKELAVPKIHTPDWSSMHLELQSSFKKVDALFCCG
jgi:hypothetical protein